MRAAAAVSSASVCGERPASQQASGAAVRSEACAALAASASSSRTSSVDGRSTPASRANAAIHSSLVTPGAYPAGGRWLAR